MTTLKLRLFGAAATLALLSACSASSDPERTTVPETAVEPTAAPSAKKTAALPGKLGLLTQALAKVTLRPEQKTEIDKLVSEAAVRHEGVSKARNALKNAVATQLESGSFNRAELSGEVAALESAVTQTAAADRAALVRLHGILDSAQRNQLVDAFQELRRPAKAERGFGRRGEHGMLFKAREWARDLSLTDEQVGTIRSAMRDKFQADRTGKGRDGWRRGGHKQLFEAFRSDNFTLDENTFPAARRARGASRMLEVLEVAVPTLTPDQKKRAAEKLRASEF
jgi:Spy/CpxP family protein refolding chaperone